MRIVVNADDFGLSRDTFAATAECLESGLLTSATIMVGMPMTEAALGYAKTHPERSFGVHLVFTGDGAERPLSAASEVSSLVDEAGAFRPTRELRVAALFGRLPVDEIEREAAAQIDYVRAHGVSVSHVDSHRHLHKLPSFRDALRRVLPRMGIDRVRAVQDVYLSRPFTTPTYWLGRRWQRALAASFTSTDHFYMPTSAGDRDWHRVAGRLPADGSLEVGVHPGYEEAWRGSERGSLAPFVAAVTESGHRLVTWREIR